MRVVDGVKEFNVDNSDEKLSAFLGYLKDIYAEIHTHIQVNFRENQWDV